MQTLKSGLLSGRGQAFAPQCHQQQRQQQGRRAQGVRLTLLVQLTSVAMGQHSSSSSSTGMVEAN
jgi:hypothetical protein